MSVRVCDTTKDVEVRASRRITLPIPPDEYEALMKDAPHYRACLDKWIALYPELFPAAIQQGYVLQGVLPESKKLAGLRLRRIEVTTEPAVKRYQYKSLRPNT